MALLASSWLLFLLFSIVIDPGSKNSGPGGWDICPDALI
jgi:hypothetical protein